MIFITRLLLGGIIMTDYLVKKFIKNYEDTSNPEVRSEYGKFSGKVGIVCNVLLFIFG